MIILTNTSQVVSLTPTAQRGSVLGELNLTPNGAVVINGDKIVEAGDETTLLERYPHTERLDALGMAVVPGFVDPHTHLVWAGNRASEFEMRLQGKTYMEIMAAGGGIASTVSATRQASLDEIISQSHQRALNAFRHGSTTIEVKTGYGLNLDSEIKQLEAILEMNKLGPYELVPTYMGAHAIPAEYKNNPAGFIHFLTTEALPALAQWWQTHASEQPLPYVDVFCEEGVFDLEQTHMILSVAKALGFPLKLHADEFVNLGGAALAAELGAVSADHLVKTSMKDIRALAATDTVAVSLPGTPFGLGQTEYTPARDIVAADGYLALASDLNPGTTWNESMQMIQAIACRYLKLTPAQALVASTINAAKAIDRSAFIGSLTAGKQADLLILNTPDYRDLTYRYGTNQVQAVIKKGQIYPIQEG